MEACDGRSAGGTRHWGPAVTSALNDVVVLLEGRRVDALCDELHELVHLAAAKLLDGTLPVGDVQTAGDVMRILIAVQQDIEGPD